MTVDNARQKKSSSLTRGVICLVLSVLFAAVALIVAFFFKKADASQMASTTEMSLLWRVAMSLPGW